MFYHLCLKICQLKNIYTLHPYYSSFFPDSGSTATLTPSEDSAKTEDEKKEEQEVKQEEKKEEKKEETAKADSSNKSDTSE